MPFEHEYGDSAEEINPIADQSDVLIFNSVSIVDWREGVPEGSDRYWRFRGYVDFESPFQEHPIANIIAEPWNVLRRTPKGAWITGPYSNKWTAESGKRFVLDSGRKRFAYPTKKLAWESYCIRLRHRRGYWQTEGKRIELLSALVANEADR